jgi:hypothetical protein
MQRISEDGMRDASNLSSEDFQQAHDDEVSSRKALGLLLASAVTVCGTFGVAWLLSMVIA